MSMISEHGSTRLRDSERERIYRSNRNIAFRIEQPIIGNPPFAYEFQHDPSGYWTVLDRETGIFGHGEEFLDALRDFHLAVVQHLDVLEQESELSEELAWQLDYLRARIQR